MEIGVRREGSNVSLEMSGEGEYISLEGLRVSERQLVDGIVNLLVDSRLTTEQDKK